MYSSFISLNICCIHWSHVPAILNAGSYLDVQFSKSWNINIKTYKLLDNNVTVLDVSDLNECKITSNEVVFSDHYREGSILAILARTIISDERSVDTTSISLFISRILQKLLLTERGRETNLIKCNWGKYFECYCIRICSLSYKLTLRGSSGIFEEFLWFYVLILCITEKH